MNNRLRGQRRRSSTWQQPTLFDLPIQLDDPASTTKIQGKTQDTSVPTGPPHASDNPFPPHDHTHPAPPGLRPNPWRNDEDDSRDANLAATNGSATH